MADWQTGDVVANGIRIHYVRTGGNKPPLVLNHGATANGLSWLRVARALETDYDVIMPDARGHGLSDAPEAAYGSGERATDLAAFIQTLGLDHPVVGGHSMGGSTSLRFAADYPDVPRAAILEDPGMRAPGAPAASVPNPMRQLIEEAHRSSLEQVMAMGRARYPSWDEEEFRAWALAKQQTSLTFLDRQTFAGETPWQELVPKITCPTLLITSDPERGGIVTPEVAAEARRLNPRISVVRISGAGHEIRREQFDAFISAVRGFLNQLPQTVATA